MTPSQSVLAADWLGACRRAAREIRAQLDEPRTRAERLEETGTIGEGGDRTLILDAAAEDAVFAQLDALHAQGLDFFAISEERGFVAFGEPDPDDCVRVVIDPIDGSLNAKRGLPHHALSIAVADGPTMADVAFAYVYDFGPDEEWTARQRHSEAIPSTRPAATWHSDTAIAPRMRSRRAVLAISPAR
jgi:myo-inositol-1(or 4)-monophosphatase